MMKREPELMTNALSLHNSLVNKARWCMHGYTIEQEGDSFTLAFYDGGYLFEFEFESLLLKP